MFYFGSLVAGQRPAANSRTVNLNTTSHLLTRHNIFIDCTLPCLMGAYSAAMYERSKQQWEEYFKQRDWRQLPHAQKYPELLKFWDEPRQYPDTNVFSGNLIYNPNVPLPKQYGKIPLVDRAIIEAGGSLQQRDNWVTMTDPGFVDAAAGNYTLRPEAEVFTRIAGFKAIPFKEIGPRVTPGRQ